MRITRRRSLIAGALLAVGVAATQAVAPPAQAALLGIALPVDMGSPQLLANAWVTDYADTGLAFGQSGADRGAPDLRGTVWRNGRVIDLGVKATPLSANKLDQVVGYQGTPDSKTARMWRPDGTSVDLMPGTQSMAVVVNDRGEALVQSGATIGVWRPTGGFTPLPIPGTPLSLTSYPTFRNGELNNNGQVAVSAKDGDQAYAVRCDAAGCVRLPNPPGKSINAVQVVGMNDAGQILGKIEIRPTSGNPNATVWRATLWQGGEVVLLDTLGGEDSAVFGPHALNERGEVIGSARTAEGPMKPVVWRDRRPVVLGDTLSYLKAINDSGDIVGGGGWLGGNGFLIRGGKTISLPPYPLVSLYQGVSTLEIVGIADTGKIIGTTSRPIAPYPYSAGTLYRATTWTIL